ncbi:hypothetical protein Dsin_007506, partial [Dipteronia sinensis]
MSSSKCLQDEEDSVEFVRNCPTEFKQALIQLSLKSINSIMHRVAKHPFLH